MTFKTSLPPAHPLSRMQLLSAPIANPGKCAVCGTPSRPVVDFGMSLDYYGAVYLCEDCITEAGRAVGMVTAKEFARAEADSSEAFEVQLSNRDMVGIPRERYNAIVVAISGLSDVLLFGDNSGTIVVAGPHGEIQPALFNDSHDGERESTENIESAVGDTEQDDNPAVSEGPISVPSDNKPGSSFNF